MIRYREAADDESFEYGVLTYLDGDDDPVTAEGYLAGSVMGENGESVVEVAEPERTVQVPFRRVVKIRYPTEE